MLEMMLLFLFYLLGSGPGGAETTLIPSSVISEPEAFIGSRISIPGPRSDLNESGLLVLTTDEPELSILDLVSIALPSRRLPPRITKYGEC